MDLTDYIVLHHASNSCCTQITTAHEYQKQHPELQIDLKRKIWTHPLIIRFNQVPSLPIGGARASTHINGIIGVYDRTNITQLNDMLFDSREATRPLSSVFDGE